MTFHINDKSDKSMIKKQVIFLCEHVCNISENSNIFVSNFLDGIREK